MMSVVRGAVRMAPVCSSGKTSTSPTLMFRSVSATGRFNNFSILLLHTLFSVFNHTALRRITAPRLKVLLHVSFQFVAVPAVDSKMRLPANQAGRITIRFHNRSFILRPRACSGENADHASSIIWLTERWRHTGKYDSVPSLSPVAHVPQEQRALAEQGTSSSILLIRLRNTQRHAVLWAFHSRLGYTSESSSCASFMKPAPLHPPAVTRQPCPSARSYGGFRTATWPYSAASAAFPYSISLIDKSQDFQRTLLNGGKEGFEPT